MREIKFRAWIGSGKVMIPWEDTGFDSDTEYYDNVSAMPMCYFSGIDNEADDYTFMQSTGIKDKNGKEIYEGDIVRMVYVNDEGGGWRSNEKIEQGEVYFDPTWGVKFDCSDGTQRTADYWKHVSYHPADTHDIEVVGNKFENPELLTK